MSERQLPKVLVVDDDPLARRILLRMLRPSYQAVALESGEKALRHLSGEGADLVLTDLRMPQMDGLELLTQAKKVSPETIVLVITGYSSVDSAVAAIKKGAYDYLTKPFEPDDVLIRLERALTEQRLRQKVVALERERELQADHHTLLTEDPKMHEVLDMVRRVARTGSTVLIQGETGTGKELVARMVHRLSLRTNHAFVPVNCSALAEGVMESELFGHEKGAFTGAVEKRLGFFELAHRGTLLLDEIGTTGPKFQIKLLRALQEQSIYRVGSPIPLPVDVRVIAATNQNLEQDARQDRFRSDLYYRLSVVTITVPPLRERSGDIPLLAEHFLKKHRHLNPLMEGISPAGMKRLRDYPFPGNVRELENVIERALILESGTVLTPASLLIENDTGLAPPAPDSLCMETAEKEHILHVLAKCGGKKSEAARLLGINKTTLWRKMKKYGMQ